MMLNEVLFAGNVGKDPTTFETEKKTKIIKFSLCHTKKGKDGKPESTWINVTSMGYTTDIAENIRKGDNVIVKGSVQNNSWKDKKSGEKKYETFILASQISIAKKFERQDKSTAQEQPDYGF